MTQTTMLSITAGRVPMGSYWFAALDGDDHARALFDRHYSRHFYKDGRQPKLFVGPGEKLVLVREGGLFVWRKFRSVGPWEGVNCAVFRNESPVLSSLLILDAEGIAWRRWPGANLYTFVNPRGIRSKNPGACFRKAGWKRTGITKWNQLVVLEKPCPAPSPNLEPTKEKP